MMRFRPCIKSVPSPFICRRAFLELMEPNQGVRYRKLKEIFADFSASWMKYWESYVRLQERLYESLRAGREVSWLAAADERELSEINQVQRELFSRMPRRLDYEPLGQITRDLGSAPSKIAELEAALSREEEGCRSLEEAIVLMKGKVGAMKEAMRLAGP